MSPLRHKGHFMSHRKPSSQMAGDWQVTCLKFKHPLRFQNKITPSTPFPGKVCWGCQRQWSGKCALGPGRWNPNCFSHCGDQGPKLANGLILSESQWARGGPQPCKTGEKNAVLGFQEMLAGWGLSERFASFTSLLKYFFLKNPLHSVALPSFIFLHWHKI